MSYPTPEQEAQAFAELAVHVAATEKLMKDSAPPDSKPDIEQAQLATPIRDSDAIEAEQTASYLREILSGADDGTEQDLEARAKLHDKIIQEAVEGRPVGRLERAHAESWRKAHMNDPEWSKRYLDGDPFAAKQMLLANLIFSAPMRFEEPTK